MPRHASRAGSGNSLYFAALAAIAAIAIYVLILRPETNALHHLVSLLTH